MRCLLQGKRGGTLKKSAANARLFPLHLVNTMLYPLENNNKQQITCDWDTHTGCGKIRGWRLRCDRCSPSAIPITDYSVPQTRQKNISNNMDDILRELREAGGA